MNRLGYLLALLFLFLLTGCSGEIPESKTPLLCVNCHELKLDVSHQQECTSCHKGQSSAEDKTAAHVDLVAFPAHPDLMLETCGSCHAEIVAKITSSSHFTLKNSTNLFRTAFGADKELESFREVGAPVSFPETGLELVDDLLRRRCFRCHVYYKGDDYPSTQHGTGCAACHLELEDGKLNSHSFSKPSDARCLTCHYGNYVGFDYFGRFEQDFNDEYRTPYTTREKYFRPYGVEYRQLRSDIHQQKGLSCIDCHSGDELMLSRKDKVSCKSCHQLEEVQKKRLPQIKQQKDGFTFASKDGTVHDLPILHHPAHFSQNIPVACQSCHAGWTYNDTGKHFIRTDTDDQDAWFNLSVQGSMEVETIIENNSDYDKDELLVQMTDKLTGQQYPGIWIKGFTQRRWESVELGFDEQGILTPVRPVLDYYLSWIDEDETVQFDSITPQPGIKMVLPYVPHTTGSAGAFYQERIDKAINKNQE